MSKRLFRQRLHSLEQPQFLLAGLPVLPIHTMEIYEILVSDLPAEVCCDREVLLFL